MKVLKILPVLVFSVFFYTNLYISVNAYESTISSTVKTNICGNGVVEGPPEDCEGGDLNGGSCISEGYLEGELSCDISCTYDYSNCSGTPTPTPVPTLTPQNNNSGQQPANSSNNVSVVEIITNEFTANLANIIREFVSGLPAKLSYMDVNGDGIIDYSEMNTAISLWIDAWKSVNPENCDLNIDGRCDISDFSVLLFYVE